MFNWLEYRLFGVKTLDNYLVCEPPQVTQKFEALLTALFDHPFNLTKSQLLNSGTEVLFKENIVHLIEARTGWLSSRIQGIYLRLFFSDSTTNNSPPKAGNLWSDFITGLRQNTIRADPKAVKALVSRLTWRHSEAVSKEHSSQLDERVNAIICKIFLSNSPTAIISELEQETKKKESRVWSINKVFYTEGPPVVEFVFSENIYLLLEKNQKINIYLLRARDPFNYLDNAVVFRILPRSQDYAKINQIYKSCMSI